MLITAYCTCGFVIDVEGEEQYAFVMLQFAMAPRLGLLMNRLIRDNYAKPFNQLSRLSTKTTRRGYLCLTSIPSRR